VTRVIGETAGGDAMITWQCDATGCSGEEDDATIFGPDGWVEGYLFTLVPGEDQQSAETVHYGPECLALMEAVS